MVSTISMIQEAYGSLDGPEVWDGASTSGQSPVSRSRAAAFSQMLRGKNILIDARKVGDGGIGTYIVNLVEGLLRFSSCRVTLLVFPAQELPERWSEFRERLRVRVTKSGLYSLRELFLLPREIDWAEVSLFHSPHFTIPLYLPVPGVVTIHDLIQISHPERWFYPFVAGLYLRNALRVAKSVVAVSEATKRELLIQFPRYRGSIRVIPNAIVEGVEVNCSESSGREYLLAVVSNKKPHKGIERLLGAYRQFHRQLGSRCPDLVLVGAGTTDLSDAPGVYCRGTVDASELNQLYAEASGLIVASTIEGFCLPVIEARLRGTPTISTPVPAVMELLGPSDFVSADFSVDALAAVMSDFWSKKDLLPTPRLDPKYGLEAVTSQIVELYEEVLR
jgi:glycosyltransferase involved in cell wall biosynthesis